MGGGDTTRGVFFTWAEADRLYALPLSSIQTVARMVAITPVPSPARAILGLINVHGKVTPVVSVARAFGFHSEPALDHHLIIARNGSRLLALLAWESVGVTQDEIVPAGDILPEARHLSGVLKQRGALVLLPDLEFLIRPEDVEQIEKGGAAVTGGGITR